MVFRGYNTGTEQILTEEYLNNFILYDIIIIAGRPSIIAGPHNVHCWEPKYILRIDQCPVVCARFLFKTTKENHKYLFESDWLC